MSKKGRVFVGMSGGVDSAVAAALLRQAGHEVIGVFIKVWDPADFACTWREDRREAMRVAARLDIPLVTIDLSKEYEQEVVKYMIREYRAGRTPNPDIECNREIKFGAFYRWAIKNGAAYVATGHYARAQSGALLMSVDKNKDQTYFLWTLKPAQLKKVLFPIGDYQKREVRKLAKQFGLPNFAKKDSQGLCFIGKLDLKKFLQRYIKVKKGKVVNEKGAVVGEHNGACFYTIGERHHGYIMAKDLKKNRLIVSDKLPENRPNQLVKLEKVNWLVPPRVNQPYQARIRHRGRLSTAVLKRDGATWLVQFPKSPTSLAAGQSLVLYDGQRCLGGGVML